MPSRQDQLHSYQFMVQRVVSALVLRETDPPQSPFRRVATAALASVLVGVVIAAGFGVYGVFTNRGDRSWRTEGAVIVEKGTGAVYVWRENKLHPALNLASAYLASSSAKPAKFDVSTKSLQGVPWGPTVGVPFLPDTLPNAKDLVGFPWAVCSLPGNGSPVSVVASGDQSGMAGRTVMDDEAILVKSATRSTAPTDTYLLWRGRLYEIRPSVANNLAAGVQPTMVSTAFINGVAKGQPLEPLAIAGKGSVFEKNPLWKIGDVIRVTNFQEDRYVVVRAQDLAWVSEFQAALLGSLLAGSQNPNDLTKYGPINDRLQPQPSGNPLDPPVQRPTIAVYSGSGLCSVIKDDQGTSELRADVKLDLTKRPGTAKRSVVGGVYADYVLMPPGRGAIVSSGQTYSLVAPDGVRYAAANGQVLARLGYEGISTLKLPSALIALLPEGPGLDPAEALVPVTVS
jgi:type VII secretion protein EccB